MGRKAEFAEKPVKGPGRKAKKQGPPVLAKSFKGKIVVFQNFEYLKEMILIMHDFIVHVKKLNSAFICF